MVAYGRWMPPRLVCKEIKREITTVKVIPRMPPLVVVGNLLGGADICLNIVVSGRLNVVKGLKRINQIVGFRRSRHSRRTLPFRICLARDQSINKPSGGQMRSSSDSRTAPEVEL